MLEREPGRARPITGNDERGDLDDLTLAPGRDTGLLLGAGDVGVSGGAVAAARSHHGQQRKLDREVSHVGTMRLRADARLTPR